MTDTIVSDLKSRARTWHRGNYYEDFAQDQTFIHHWGRTLTEADNTLFATLTLHYNPIYRRSAARSLALTSWPITGQ
jgi:acyl dehydratase